MGGGASSSVYDKPSQNICNPNDFKAKPCLRSLSKDEGYWRFEDCVRIQNIDPGDTLFLLYEDSYFKAGQKSKEQYFKNKVVKSVSRRENTIVFKDGSKITRYALDTHDKRGTNGTFYLDCNGHLTEKDGRHYSLKGLAIEKISSRAQIGFHVKLIY